MGGGAWPFLVGGVICLVNSVNERDLNLLNSRGNPGLSSLSQQWGRETIIILVPSGYHVVVVRI